MAYHITAPRSPALTHQDALPIEASFSQDKPPVLPQLSKLQEIISSGRIGQEIGKGSFATIHVVDHEPSLVVKIAKSGSDGDFHESVFPVIIDGDPQGDALALGLKHPYILEHLEMSIAKTNPDGSQQERYIQTIPEFCRKPITAMDFRAEDEEKWFVRAILLPKAPGDLDQFIKDSSSPKTIETIAQIIAGIGLGVDYLHSLEITHRDLKPENILLDEKGQPKICDFGLARSFYSDSDIAGSPQCLSPEMVERLRGTDLRLHLGSVDFYGLGAVLFFSIFKRYPFPLSAHTTEAKHKVFRQVIRFTDSQLEALKGQKPIPEMLHPEFPISSAFLQKPQTPEEEELSNLMKNAINGLIRHQDLREGGKKAIKNIQEHASSTAAQKFF